ARPRARDRTARARHAEPPRRVGDAHHDARLDRPRPPRPRRWRMRMSIRHKLLAVFIPAMIGVVGFLATFFSTRELDRITADLHRRAAIYGALASGQLKSAIAFSDRETAREVLSSLEIDPDISAIVLYGADRTRLYSHGAPEAWVERGEFDLDRDTV